MIIGKILGYSPIIWIIPMMIILLSQDYPYGCWKNPMIIPIGILLSPGYAINFHGISTVFFCLFTGRAGESLSHAGLEVPSRDPPAIRRGAEEGLRQVL